MQINPQSTGNTFTLDENERKAFEIYNKDMRSANKQYTQYNIPSAYALMLTHKDTVHVFTMETCTQMMVNIWLKNHHIMMLSKPS